MALKVLVVDDSATMRRMVARAVRMAGLPVEEVREAADGIEALEALAAGQADLVMLDVHMPRLDGLATLRRLRDDPRTRAQPVIVGSKP